MTSNIQSIPFAVKQVYDNPVLMARYNDTDQCLIAIDICTEFYDMCKTMVKSKPMYDHLKKKINMMVMPMFYINSDITCAMALKLMASYGEAAGKQGTLQQFFKENGETMFLFIKNRHFVFDILAGDTTGTKYDTRQLTFQF